MVLRNGSGRLRDKESAAAQDPAIEALDEEASPLEDGVPENGVLEDGGSEDGPSEDGPSEDGPPRDGVV